MQGFLLPSKGCFPVFIALHTSDTNYPGMDKMYYLSNRANDTNFWLALDFDNLDLFQPMQESSMTGIDVKMSEVYGDKVDFERYFYALIISFLVFGSN